MNKNAKIILNILILILIAIIIFLILRNFFLDYQVKKEVNDVYEMIIVDDYDYKEVYERLDNIVTKEGYAVVEDRAKDYLLDYFVEILKLDELMEYDLDSVLIDYQKTKESQEIKISLNNLKEEILEAKELMLANLNKEKMMTYINDKNLDDSYVKLYESLDFIKEKNIENRKEQITDKVNNYVNKIDNIFAVLDFLNNNEWQLVDNKVIFKDATLQNEYNELVAKIK